MAQVLAKRQIEYVHLLELGNLFKGSHEWDPNWARTRTCILSWATKLANSFNILQDPYTELFQQAGDIITKRLRELVETKPGNTAIMCACGKHTECHRNIVSGWLKKEKKYEVVHIE